MPVLLTIAKLAAEVTVLLDTVISVFSRFDQTTIKEEVDEYEKVRRDAISQYFRTTRRYVVRKDAEQRPTVLPNSRRILYVQSSINDASKHKNSGQRVNTRKYVRHELSPVRARKRPLDFDN